MNKERIEEEKRRKQEEYNKKVYEAERKEAERIRKLELIEENKRRQRIDISNIRKNHIKNMLEIQSSKISDKNIIGNYKLRVNERAFVEIPVPIQILQKGREIFTTETLKYTTKFINSERELVQYMNGYEVEGLNDLILLKQIQIFLNKNLNNILNIIYQRYENELGHRWFSVVVQNSINEESKISTPPRSPFNSNEMVIEMKDDDIMEDVEMVDADEYDDL